MLLVEHASTDESGDSVRTALYLANFSSVILAGPRKATPTERELLERGGIALAGDILGAGLGDGRASRALLDVWTNETDERVLQLRGRGVETSCLADWLLQHRRESFVGVTGTAGKSTTTALVRQLMDALYDGRVFSSRARAGNLWPTSALLDCPPEAIVVAELTSSHLAFCHSSPRLAAITNLWPDHVELHGSLAAYEAAKSRLFARQDPGDVAVLPADDEDAAGLARASPARRVWFAEGGEPPPTAVRVWTRGGELYAVSPQGRLSRDLGGLPSHLSEPVALRALLCALATTLAATTIWPGALDLDLEVLDSLSLPPHRRCIISSPDSALVIIDDSLAATPRKALAALSAGTHLVAGGQLTIGGNSVHSSQAEEAALRTWIQAMESCLSVDLFGPAGVWLAEHLRAGVVQVHCDAPTALRAAVGRAEAGRGRVLVSPGFPMNQDDRQAVAAFVWTSS